jgi:membrane fusion protein (multidrug efflux system)
MSWRASSLTLWLLLAAAVGCDTRPTPAKQQPAEPTPAPPVHVSTLSQTTLTPTAAGTAEIEAQREALLAAEAAGRVVWIGFDEGSEVKAGQVLLRVDLGRADAQLKAAQSAIAQAEAQLAQAERERELAERLVQQGSLPQQKLDSARDAERIAHAAVDSAHAQAGVSRRGLKDAVVRAPFAGTIRSRDVELGEFVSPGKPVAALVNADELQAQVLLDPRQALDVKLGAEVQIQVYARPDEVFAGRVTRVSEVVDPRTRKLPVDVEVLDPNGRLRPGLVGRFDVQVGEPRPAVMVPESAVFERFSQRYVYVLSDGRAERRPVRLGEAREGTVEILEGAKAGDRVIVRGIDRVVDGHPVRVVDAPVAEAG